MLSFEGLVLRWVRDSFKGLGLRGFRGLGFRVQVRQLRVWQSLVELDISY